ncbi:TIGR00297 family protein [Methanococcus aeolicus]|uniref:TIGR00297 family protein n=1 Tax=Methanococcus aeolicus TaxID=42879 RepID=UPI0021C8D9AF|nr:TIGR00297 family protein [Methanococcus aeolicus]UXM85164.1 TIGR00297 family protein [Methanococcus aeolicus]
MNIYLKFIYSIIITIILAYIIKKRGYLDNSGILVSSLMSFIILIGANIYWLILMVLFLVFGSIVSKIGYAKKCIMGMGESKRTIKNVLANGLIAVFVVLLNMFGIIEYIVALMGYIGAISAATSDTFSSEIGILSNETPRLITTFKKVKNGEDGGITIQGTIAGLMGSLLIGVMAGIMFNNINLIWIATISGIVGNIVDSLMGALFERKGIINNEIVNFTCTFAGCICAVLLYGLI